jgi:hypothetical protein
MGQTASASCEAQDAGLFDAPLLDTPLVSAVRRARAEYIEMPGLRLTAAQAARLWTLDAALCADVLSALVESRFLVRTRDASFVRAE